MLRALEFEKIFEPFEEQDLVFVSELKESAMTKEDWTLMKSLLCSWSTSLLLRSMCPCPFMLLLTISFMKYMGSNLSFLNGQI